MEEDDGYPPPRHPPSYYNAHTGPPTYCALCKQEMFIVRPGKHQCHTEGCPQQA